MARRGNRRAIGGMLMGGKKGIEIVEHKERCGEEEGIMMKIISLKEEERWRIVGGIHK